MVMAIRAKDYKETSRYKEISGMIISGEINHNKGKIVYRDRLNKKGYKLKVGVHIYRHNGMYKGSQIDRIRMIACFQSEGKGWRWDYKGFTAAEKKRGTIAKTAAFDIELIDEVVEAINLLRIEAFGVEKVGEAAPETKMNLESKARSLGL